MKEKLKKQIKKYIITFFVVIFFCIISLIISVMLPKNKVDENCKAAAEVYNSTMNMFPEIQVGRRSTTIDNYADAISVNIIYSLEQSRPLSSVLEAKYGFIEGKTAAQTLTKIVNVELEPNQQYSRYWHGYIVLLKPLLMFFLIEQIHIINAIILAILALIIVKQLWEIDKRAVLAFIIGGIMTSMFVVPQCFEFTWAFMVAFIVTIIVLKVDNGDNKKIYYILFVSGMLTCFFDFLTVELLSVILPLIMILIKRNRNGEIKNKKEIVKFIVISILIWGIAYIGMFIAKWIITSIVLQKNYIIDSIHKAQVRANGQVMNTTMSEMLIEAVRRNFISLYPLNLLKRKYIAYILVPISTIIMVLITRYRKRDNAYFYGLLIISLIPYIRYLVLVNHSYKHFFFTYRLQYVTIIAWIMLLINVFAKERK